MFGRFQFQFALLAILFLAACAGPRRKPTPLGRQEEMPVVVPEVKPEEPKPEEPKPAVQIPITPPVVVVPPVVTNNWISLSEWCAKNNLAAPALAASATETNVQIHGPAGTMTFEAPRRNARLNGTLIGIGFPLQFTNQHAWINTIDIIKVVEPLLLSTNAPDRKRGGVVVIDPGHGGANEGTLSFDRKWHEKELTLDWAKRLQRALEGSQWKAILTRETDLDIALTNRVAFADAKKADLFISLHFNSVGNAKEQSGLETYCFTPQGMASHLVREYADPIALAFPSNDYDIENLQLALDVHRAILKKTSAKDRGIRRARFMTVLRDQRRPSVLVEGGYLSNPAEAKLIESAAYRQKLADAIAEALGVTTPTLTTSTP